ncbi:MAG: MFS transporter [Gemmatimonadota bacterium]
MPRPRLSRTVVALGVVSLCTDASSEMIYPLLPLFLGTVLGAGPAALGVIEGLAEATASLLKLASGRWSDTLPRRKPLVLAGYGVSAVVRPLIAAAGSAGQVLAVRLADRVGKGVRSAPRDALIADATVPTERGRAFGFHRSMDHAGAVVGPLVAWALLAGGMPLRTVFWWAAVPGVLALLALWLGVREETVPRAQAVPATPALPLASGAPPARPTPLPAVFWRYLAVLFVFTLGNSSDAFLLLRASDLGVTTAHVPLLWAAHHAVKAALGTWGGGLSDRIGRRAAVATGWGVYALTYAGFAAAHASWHAWALFLGYGVFFALVEGAEKAFVAELVPATRRGAAYGWFHLAVGVGALPGSVVFGLVWQRWGAGAAFGLGAALAGVAMVGLRLAVGRLAETEESANLQSCRPAPADR